MRCENPAVHDMRMHWKAESSKDKRILASTNLGRLFNGFRKFESKIKNL